MRLVDRNILEERIKNSSIIKKVAEKDGDIIYWTFVIKDKYFDGFVLRTIEKFIDYGDQVWMIEIKEKFDTCICFGGIFDGKMMVSDDVCDAYIIYENRTVEGAPEKIFVASSDLLELKV